MKVTIENCNNVDYGLIEIVENKLNVKFGINGTGKSTITKAIKYKIDQPDSLNELLPFKHKNTESTNLPKIVIDKNIDSVLIFNEEYLNQFLFKKDELISNSYEIFINTQEFKSINNQIDTLLSGIKSLFSNSTELNQIIADFESLSKSFATTQSGLSKSAVVYKGLKDGNKIMHVPKELEGYSKLIKDKCCVTWLDWQSKGEQFLSVSDNCPYCSLPIKDTLGVINSVSDNYDKNVVKNFTVIIEALSNLGVYFSTATNDTLVGITEKQTGLNKEEMDYIVVVKQQIDNLLLRLKALKDISSVSFNNSELIEAELKDLEINMNLFDHFKAPKTVTIIGSLNKSLENVLKQVGKLKGAIIRQKKYVTDLIQKNGQSINSFLINAGYKYIVEIVSEDSINYKLVLKHTNSNEMISGGTQHLSFGEKNAFSLVLFMHEAIHKNPDLIVLDDPISSFDKNKKFAIMHMLFRGKTGESFMNKTVLMLTHDLDPIIDVIKVMKEFNGSCNASFISNKGGALSEKEIKKVNLQTFSQICVNALNADIDDIVKLIYLRRYFEIIDDMGNEYQVLSNLFHKRNKEVCVDFRKQRGDDLMSSDDFEFGVTGIKTKMSSFDYNNFFLKFNDISYLKDLYMSLDNNYAKLNIFRLIYDDKIKDINSVLRKFINESFHIENELICQLDPVEYDIVPDFIIDECNRFISNN